MLLHASRLRDAYFLELLRLLDALVPRITYGKVADAPSTEGQEMFQNATPATTSNRRDASQDPKLVQAAQAFAHIKRDLVRLLGILASDNRVVQDRVRECGGLPVVMNLCVIDDNNPCESQSKGFPPDANVPPDQIYGSMPFLRSGISFTEV